ncbi:MAG: Ig-like domain-containing protein, partial [Limnohabitans sp.]
MAPLEWQGNLWAKGTSPIPGAKNTDATYGVFEGAWWGDPYDNPTNRVFYDDAAQSTPVDLVLATLTSGPGSTLTAVKSGTASAQRLTGVEATSYAQAVTNGEYFSSTAFVKSTNAIALTALKFNQISANAGSARMAVALYDVETGSLTRLSGDISVAGSAIRQYSAFTKIAMMPGKNYELRFYAWGSSTVFIDNPQIFAFYNEAPTPKADSFSTSANNSVSGSLMSVNNGAGVDTDPEAQTLSMTHVNGTALTLGSQIALTNGVLTVTNAATGAFTFTPNNGFMGVQTFTYTVADGFGKTATATATITVTAPPPTIDNVQVTEGTGYAEFTVNAYRSESVVFSLDNAGTGAGYAVMGTDFTNSLEYFDGTNWVAYTAGSSMALTANQTVRLRVPVASDAVDESPETYLLKVSNTSGGLLTQGTGTIVDAAALSVSNVTVNEGSPYVVFKVTGVANQHVQLVLNNGTAIIDANGIPLSDGTEDYGPALQYYDGSNWQNYTASSFVTIPAGNTLLVRTSIVNDTPLDNGQTLTLTATKSTGGTATGTGTIMDDGTGDLFSISNVTGTPEAPGTNSLPALRNDDRPLAVNSVTVNEGSPYAVFTVTGAASQYVQLSMAEGSAKLDADGTALLDGTEDYGSTIEYYNGSAWVTYSANSFVQIPASGTTLLVRTLIVNDTPADNGQTFTVTATNTGGSSATGTGTIKDDGTGQKWSFASVNDTGSVTSGPSANFNDDRPVTVNTISVNEGSPYAVFTVGAKEDQYVQLTLAAGTASAGVDYTNALEYWNGTQWTPYTANSFVQVPSDGDGTGNEAANLLVRVPITNDTTPDNGETFTLTAANTGGTSATGTGTIMDDGTGQKWSFASVNDTGSVTSGPGASFNDDRPVTVNDVTVNEGSPYLVFTVTGNASQYVQLTMAEGTAKLDANGTPLADGSEDYGPLFEYHNGSAWVTYTPGSFVQIPSTGTTMLVRTSIVNDVPLDNSETVTLTAFNTGGTGDV